MAELLGTLSSHLFAKECGGWESWKLAGLGIGEMQGAACVPGSWILILLPITLW